ncbi:hypothetical protein AKJ16_DCAP12973 [Drosera capensis]
MEARSSDIMLPLFYIRINSCDDPCFDMIKDSTLIAILDFYHLVVGFSSTFEQAISMSLQFCAYSRSTIDKTKALDDHVAVLVLPIAVWSFSNIRSCSLEFIMWQNQPAIKRVAKRAPVGKL